MTNISQSAFLRVLLLVTALLASACEARSRGVVRSPGADASTATADSGGGLDVGSHEDPSPERDSGVDPSPPGGGGELLDECTEDAECGDGLYCTTTWPTRFCTRACDGRGSCGAEVKCVDDVCAPPCRSGARDCDPFGGACMADLYCVPTCEADTGSEFDCSEGLVCDSHLGRCVSTITSAGVEVGGACTAHEDCRSGLGIFEPAEAWPGGYCVALTRSPGRTADDTLAYAGCPLGSAIAERESDVVGDVALCFRACTGQEDCRPEHACRGASGAPAGICFPD